MFGWDVGLLALRYVGCCGWLVVVWVLIYFVFSFGVGYVLVWLIYAGLFVELYVG